MNNSNQPQNQKPFDVVLNEQFGKYQKNGFSRNWFVPIVKEQSEMDNLIKIRDNSYPSMTMEEKFPNILLDVNKDDEGNLTSIYVLYSKGGKLFKVVSPKDYGVIKSRMELKKGKYVPYEKCDLVPFDGTVEEYDEYDDSLITKSIPYKNGMKDGESFTYYKKRKYVRNEETNQMEIKYLYEKTTFKNGKKNGEFENTKYGIKGNYVNNKKNGVWEDSHKDICKSLSSSCKFKFDLHEWDVKKLIQSEFGIFSESDFNKIDRVSTVTYMNDLLNGNFKIGFWEGKFKLGLPHGVMKKELNDRWEDEITTKYFDNGIIVSDVFYEREFREKDEEITYHINRYENGLKTNSIGLSSDPYETFPSELTSETNQFLTQDVFHTIIMNGLKHSSLETFFDSFVVLYNINFNIDHYGRNKISNEVQIRLQRLDYGISSRDDFSDYLTKKCGYPYYEVIEYPNGKTLNKILKFDPHEYYEIDDYPHFPCLVKSGEIKKIFIDGELIDETIGGEINPIVLERQKEKLQNLSSRMKYSYDMEMEKRKERKKREEELKKWRREELGLSINSFPKD